ncbi:HAMP domain-containing sensor histidine kinase [Olivibacter sp. CPCC 100613]|uniref:HAMP domain-containing sensor histidine kinase n=1 Tax=Olivibacter sp. CPCC 100613 TaxID=3079931 RepID=UPI002FFB8F0A
MTLRLKLAWNSTLIVTIILGITFTGTFLLFKQHVRHSFFQQLQSRAFTAAFFHLEKDELNAQKYELIEQRYREIHRESIRFFNKENRMVFEYDTLRYEVPSDVLDRIRRRNVLYFTDHERQFTGIFYRDNEGDYVVVASDIDTAGLAQLDKLKRYLLISLLLGVCLSFLLTQLLAKQTFRPFSQLIRDVNSISAKNLHARLAVTTKEKDELTALTEAFNLFLVRLEKGVDSQRNFLKHASHELKTPLAAIISNLEITLSRPRTEKEYQEQMHSLHIDALHIKSILEGLLTLSGLEASSNISFAPLRVDELLWDLLEKTSITNPQALIQIDLQQIEQKPHLLEAKGNRDLLMISLGNLIDNALKFSDNQPVSVLLTAHENRLRLIIKDKGTGIEPSELTQIFTLFYRSPKKQSIPGHGIGLHLSKQILDLHHIEISVRSVLGDYTEFTLLFPTFR